MTFQKSDNRRRNPAGISSRNPEGFPLLTIGEFSRRCRLTTKALRLYDKLGLLCPVTVDQSSGYRYYSDDQVDTARLIGLLRGSDMSLNEIGELLTAAQRDGRVAIDLLNRFLEDLESRHSSRRVLIRHVHSILRKEDHTMFPIQTRHVDSQRVMSIQRRLHASEIGAFVAEAKAAFASHLGDFEPISSFIVVFHGIVDDESDGPIEAILGCPDDIGPTDLVGVRTEPAHDEAYTTITKAQWEFPAILAAYDAVACSPEATARPGSKLSCREVYVAEADDVGAEDLICDIAFPLG
ncbi:MAG: MerR family transcriptional regulator [Acidimicrobiales bacterium]